MVVHPPLITYLEPPNKYVVLVNVSTIVLPRVHSSFEQKNPVLTFCNDRLASHFQMERSRDNKSIF